MERVRGDDGHRRALRLRVAPTSEADARRALARGAPCAPPRASPPPPAAGRRSVGSLGSLGSCGASHRLRYCCAFVAPQIVESTFHTSLRAGSDEASVSQWRRDSRASWFHRYETV